PGTHQERRAHARRPSRAGRPGLFHGGGAGDPDHATGVWPCLPVDGLRHHGADLCRRHDPRRNRGERDQAHLQGSHARPGAHDQHGEEPEGRDRAGLHAASHDARALKMSKVAVEKEGPVTVVSIDRFTEARNAVDPEPAVLLREAFLAFDADETQSVAILTGRGGTFCAGYDLKVAASHTGPPTHDPEGPGPMGPTRHLLSKPV